MGAEMESCTTHPSSELHQSRAMSQNSPTQETDINANSFLSTYNRMPKTTYSSPPPVACNPENNVCKLIDYRGAKVAAFMVDGRELTCLPQAFELFLKHLVGGLHTVYTKLKRLEITPVVCNVEQVRILRGLGAIQPGVNRCKLISCKEFDILYDDCTNSSARPGRPPKRSPSIQASPETLDKLKKSRLDGTEFPYDPRMFESKALMNGFPPHPYAMGPIPFMPLNHPMMSPPVTMAMASHLGFRPDAAFLKERARSEVEHLMSPRIMDERNENLLKTNKCASPRSDCEKRKHTDFDQDKPLNLHVNGHVTDNSTKHSINSHTEDEDDDQMSEDDRDDDLDGSDNLSDSTHISDECEKTPSQNQQFNQSLLNGDTPGISSIETLLLNIQGLLKVAAENAKHHERQLSLEKAELKIELLRERDIRESAEKHLVQEQKVKVALQKRLKKEKRSRRRLQERLDAMEQCKQSVAVLPDTDNRVSPVLQKQNECESDEKENEKCISNDVDRSSPDTLDHSSSHGLFEGFLSHSNGSGSNRFPYMPLMTADVK